MITYAESAAAKSNLSYDRDTKPKQATNGKANLRGLAQGQTTPKKRCCDGERLAALPDFTGAGSGLLGLSLGQQSL